MPSVGSMIFSSTKVTLMPDPMAIYLCCGWLNILFGSIALIQKRISGAMLAWAIISLFWVIQMVSFFMVAGSTSLSGVAPTFGIAALVICLWQGGMLKRDYKFVSIRPRVNAFFLTLLACGSLLIEERFHDSFMMGYVFAKLFFLSRPLSLGLTFFALGGVANNLLKADEHDHAMILKQSKNAAFLAAIIFLGGEICGCYWGFMGWGTTWRWSGNFYFSAMLFVLFMVSLHVPRSLFSSTKAWNFGFSIPLIVIAIAMTLSKVMNL
jgi:hypothetical protein